VIDNGAELDLALCVIASLLPREFDEVPAW
jgi:hypothetical protein